MKSVLNVKKKSNLIKGVSSHNVCSGIKSQQKKHICHSVPKTFSKNSSVSFHRVTFDHSISCALLIDNLMKNVRTPKSLKEIPYPSQKKAIKKKRK